LMPALLTRQHGQPYFLRSFAHFSPLISFISCIKSLINSLLISFSRKLNPHIYHKSSLRLTNIISRAIILVFKPQTIVSGDGIGMITIAFTRRELNHLIDLLELEQYKIEHRDQKYRYRRTYEFNARLIKKLFNARGDK
jgi:hypothetical protein